MATSRTQYLYASQMRPTIGRLMRLARIRVVERQYWCGATFVRASWGGATFSTRHRAMGLGLKLIDWGRDDDDPHYSVNIVVPTLSIFLRIPQWVGLASSKFNWMGEGYRSWGFMFSAIDREFPSQLHLQWGRRYKFLDLPWSRVLVRRSYLLKTGTWYHVHYDTPEHRAIERARRLNWWRGLRGLPAVDIPSLSSEYADQHRQVECLNKYTERHPYCYVLESGEAQDTVADLTVEECETRRRWLRWTPWLAEVSRSIDVWFADEVGEGRGSYKGGVLGTGHRMLPGELPVHTIARMQQERRFR